MGNPQDQFTMFKKTDDPVADLAALNELANEGFKKIEATLSYLEGVFLVLSAYKD